jgi:hypothetical protein
MVVDAARRWWAAPRRRQSIPTPSPEGLQKATAARLALFLPLVVVAAVLLCAATGFLATRISKGHIEAEQRAALQLALDEFHAQIGDGDMDAPDDVQLRGIARRSGLADLRFDTNPKARRGGRSNPCTIRADASLGGSVGRATAGLSEPWTGCGPCWHCSAQLSECARS